MCVCVCPELKHWNAVWQLSSSWMNITSTKLVPFKGTLKKSEKWMINRNIHERQMHSMRWKDNSTEIHFHIATKIIVDMIALRGSMSKFWFACQPDLSLCFLLSLRVVVFLAILWRQSEYLNIVKNEVKSIHSIDFYSWKRLVSHQP